MEKILLVGHHPEHALKVAKVLKSKGYEIEQITAFAKANQVIEKGECQLLICWLDEHKDGHEFFERLKSQHPHFPTICFKGENKIRGDLYREICKSDIPDKSLARKIKKLLQISKLARQVREIEERESHLRHFLSQAQLTNPADMIPKAAQLLAEMTRAENVVWLSTFYIFCPELAAPTADNKALSQQQLWANVDSFSLNSSVVFSRFSKLIDTNPIKGRIWEYAREGVTVLPIRNLKDTGNTGFFILVKPQRIPNYFQEVVWQLENRLAFAFEYEQARQLSYIDDLTKLYNQRYLPLVLEQEMNRASRDGRKFSILFLDVDFFKHVNDTKGHLVGSQVLVQISEVIRQCTRNYDFGFRYGGDEFVVVLPGSDVQQASQIAERIRQQVENSTFRVLNSEIKVTVSIGIANFPDHAKTPEQVLQLADQAMYYGKHASRNIVYIAS